MESMESLSAHEIDEMGRLSVARNSLTATDHDSRSVSVELITEVGGGGNIPDAEIRSVSTLQPPDLLFPSQAGRGLLGAGQ
jgi:hypothetical protein